MDYKDIDMKRRELLNGREEEMMYIMWDMKEPSTSVEMLDRLLDNGWNRSTVFNTIQSLIDKGFLRVIGVERNHTQYARQFEPAITREEYAAKLLIAKGLDCDKLGNIAIAMIGSDNSSNDDKKGKDRKKELIKELEATIARLKERE